MMNPSSARPGFDKWQRRLLPAALLALLHPTPEAFAQARSMALEEVIVTARKRAESVQDVPIAITSLSGEDLQVSGVARFDEVTFHVPNMVMTTSPGNGGSPRFAIRGQTVGDVVGTVDQAIGTYVDDVFYARPAGTNINLSDIDRVEVLRGPQGTLFGRNTTGGAILIHTKDPHHDFAFRVGGGIGNYERRTWNAMVNAPLLKDKLAVRIAVDASRHDGYVENPITGVDVHDEDVISGQVKLLFEPTDNFRALFKHAYAESDHRGFEQKLVGARNLRGQPFDYVQMLSGFTDAYANYLDDSERTYENIIPQTQLQANTSSLILDWDLGAFAVKFIGAYRTTDTGGLWDLDGTPYPIAYTDGYQLGGDQASAELQFLGDAFDSRIEWIVGLYAFKEDGSDTNTTPVFVPAQDLGPLGTLPVTAYSNTDGDYRNESQALFGQLSWEATDSLTLTLGLRYSDESKELVSRNNTMVVPTTVPIQIQQCNVNAAYRSGTECRGELDRSDDSVDGNFMVEFQVNPDLLVYGKYSTGFRSGGINIRGVDTVQFAEVDPETVEEFEIGLKGDFLNRRLRVNFAAFYDDYQDIQRSNIRPSPTNPNATQNVTVNAASATIYGAELELTAALTESLQAGISGGYTDASYDDFEDQIFVGGVPVTVDRSDESFIGTPEWTFSAWTSYVVNMPFGPLTLRADYSWHDEYQSFLSTDTLGMVTPAKGTLNARAMVSVLGERLDVALWGKNLTDERYATAAINFYENWGAGVAVYNEPRTFGVDVTYRFGE